MRSGLPHQHVIGAVYDHRFTQIFFGVLILANFVVSAEAVPRQKSRASAYREFGGRHGAKKTVPPPPNATPLIFLYFLHNHAFRGNFYKICVGNSISMGKCSSNIVKIGFKLAEIEDFRNYEHVCYPLEYVPSGSPDIAQGAAMKLAQGSLSAKNAYSSYLVRTNERCSYK